jgi:hypothetical protein
MNRTALLILGSLLAAWSTFARSERSFQAAGFGGNSIGIYVDVQYAAPEPSRGGNLVVQKAGAIVVTHHAGDRIEQIKVECRDSPSMLEPYQQSPYGKGSEGVVVSLECEQGGHLILALVDEMAAKFGKPGGLTCGRGGTLNTKALASVVSFGHQAFCLEDWSSVADPAARLAEEFERRVHK